MRRTLLAFILLTSLDGKPIWIESTSVDIIKNRGATECHHEAGAVIKLGGTALCVRETAEQIKELIENADRH